MTKRELEDKYCDLHSENSRLQYNLAQYEDSFKNYRQQIAKLKIANKKLREKLKLTKTS